MPAVTESTLPTYRLTEEQALLRDAVRTLADEGVDTIFGYSAQPLFILLDAA